MKAKKIIQLLTVLFLFKGVDMVSQCGQNINLGTAWAQKGPTSAGTWSVTGGGTTVTQSINGAPTFYVSSQNYIDVKINGTFKVNTANDDDFVGFVFGYKDPITPPAGNIQKYFLFDWKQATQNGSPPTDTYSVASEGFSFVKVDTTIDLTNDAAMEPLYWGHTSHPGFNVLTTDYGAGKGWADFTSYQFSLTYTTKLIVIVVAGDTIVNLPGCYEPGRFGFYNLSQDQAVYSNFSYSLIADFDFNVTNACINQPISFSALNNACQTSSYSSPIKNWSWNLGDGTTIVDTNIVHSYTTPGNYSVTLTVSDSLGCQTPLTKPISVRGLKATQTTTVICPGDSTKLTCNLAQSGASYQWFKNGVAATSPTVNDTGFYAHSSGSYSVQISNAGGYLCNTNSNTLTVTVESKTVTITASDTVVCSGNNVVLTANTIAGVSYQWYKNAVSQGVTATTYTTNTATSYYAAITTTNSCVFQSNTITLSAGTLPTAAIAATATVICPGQLSTLTTTLQVGETVQWYKGSTLQTGQTATSYSATQTGNYTAVVTNASGCSSTSNSITVTVSSVPSASLSASPANFCPGTTSITVTSNTVSGASYAWLLNGNLISGATASTYSATTAGQYRVIITNASGCSDTSAIKNPQNATASSFTVLATDTSFCSGTNTSITANLESGDTYAWFNNGNSVGSPAINHNNISVSNAGSYYVKVTNSFGCISVSDSIALTVLPLPTATISSTASGICSGGNVTFTANSIAGATYQWFQNGTSLGTAQVNDTVLNVTQTGSYYVLISNACSKASNTITINQLNTPAQPGSISGNNSFCDGESDVFSVNSVSGATSYNWTVSPANAASIGSGQGTNQVTVNTTNQNFSLSVTAANSCGVSTASTYAISMLSSSSGTCSTDLLFAANKTNVCTNSSVVFTNYTNTNWFPGSTVSWNFGTGASPATATGNGPYTVTYSSTGLKTVTMEYLDMFSNPIGTNTKTNYINVSGSVSTSTITGNQSVSCNATGINYQVANTTGSTYNWTVPSGATIVSGQGTNAIVVNFGGTTGNVSVQETNSGGCVGSAVNLAVTCTTTGIASIENSVGFSIAPNPAENEVTIYNSTGKEVAISIIDIAGKLMMGSKPIIEKSSVINVSQFAPGLYYIQVVAENKSSVLKFIKL